MLAPMSLSERDITGRNIRSPRQHGIVSGLGPFQSV